MKDANEYVKDHIFEPRECALISVSLSDLFNKSLTSGIFPDDWKCARVTELRCFLSRVSDLI